MRVTSVYLPRLKFEVLHYGSYPDGGCAHLGPAHFGPPGGGGGGGGGGGVLSLIGRHDRNRSRNGRRGDSGSSAL